MKSIRVQTINGGFCIVHVADSIVDLKVGKRTYTLEYCESLGPTFYFKNDKVYLPSHRAPIWKVFAKWLSERRAK